MGLQSSLDIARATDTYSPHSRVGNDRQGRRRSDEEPADDFI